MTMNVNRTMTATDTPTTTATMFDDDDDGTSTADDRVVAYKSSLSPCDEYLAIHARLYIYLLTYLLVS